MKQRKLKIRRVPILALAVAAIVVPTAQARHEITSGAVSPSSSYKLEIRSEGVKQLSNMTLPSAAFSSPYWDALELKSTATKQVGGLTLSSTAYSSPYWDALELKSTATKQDGSVSLPSKAYSSPYWNALELRSKGMNERYVESQGAVSQTVSSSNGFNWSDAGIGAGTAFGSAMVLLGAVIAGRRRKSQLAV
jgi:hypothetical protein